METYIRGNETVQFVRNGQAVIVEVFGSNRRHKQNVTIPGAAQLKHILVQSGYEMATMAEEIAIKLSERR